MAELDDFQLDDDLLREIEEEARKLAEAELRDSDILKEIEEAALAEAGIDADDLDDELLREIERDILSDVDFEAVVADTTAPEPTSPPPSAAPAKTGKPVKPTTSVSPARSPAPNAQPSSRRAQNAAARAAAVKATPDAGGGEPTKAVAQARRAALQRAKSDALKNARTRASRRARQVASSAHSVSVVREQVEAEKPAGNRKLMAAVVGGCVLVLASLFLLVAMLENAKSGDAEEGGAPAAPPPVSVQDLSEVAYRQLLLDIRKTTKVQSAENLEHAIGMLEKFKAEHADYAKDCDREIQKFQRVLSFVKNTQ